MTIRQVLTQYSFSHKFYILFSVSCARSVSNKTTDSAETNRYLDVIEAYAFGKASKEELEVVKTKLYATAAYAVTYAAYAAYNAADAAADAAAYVAADAATYTATAYNAAAVTANKKILILMIKALSKLELEFIGIDKKLRLFMEE